MTKARVINVTPALVIFKTTASTSSSGFVLSYLFFCAACAAKKSSLASSFRFSSK